MAEEMKDLLLTITEELERYRDVIVTHEARGYAMPNAELLAKDIIAKLLKHRSRPELRQEITKLLLDKIGRVARHDVCGDCHYFFADADKCESCDMSLSELIYCPQDWDFCEALADQLLLLYEEESQAAFNRGFEQGKFEERERIIAWGLEICPHWSGELTREVGVIKRDCSRCWQALKGE